MWLAPPVSCYVSYSKDDGLLDLSTMSIHYERLLMYISRVDGGRKELPDGPEKGLLLSSFMEQVKQLLKACLLPTSPNLLDLFKCSALSLEI
jgi:hypothetical protein